jgi:hypothetical protein
MADSAQLLDYNNPDEEYHFVVGHSRDDGFGLQALSRKSAYCNKTSHCKFLRHTDSNTNSNYYPAN